MWVKKNDFWGHRFDARAVTFYDHYLKPFHEWDPAQMTTVITRIVTETEFKKATSIRLLKEYDTYKNKTLKLIRKTRFS
jgi:hypothetical protein